MDLYHGTSTEHLDVILRDGLLPRAKTKHSGNWEGRIQSKSEFVYLTTASPVYYAYAAAAERDDEDLVVIQVDPFNLELFPDEDFIAHCLQREQPERELQDLSFEVDPAEYEKVSYLLHSGDPKMLWSRRGPAPALSRPGRGPAPTTEETPALLLRRPSGGLWMQRGRLVSEDHCTPMGPACLPQTRTATGWGYLSQVNS